MTQELVRRRSEHHPEPLDTLEELSLHQLAVSDLSQLPVMCPRLQTLLLPNNLLASLGKCV